MDAVELPLPAKVDFSKIISPPAATEGRAMDAGGGDMKEHLPNAESCSSYRSKKTSSDCMQKSLPLSFRSENNGRRHYLGEIETVLSLPKQDGKALTKKSIKMLSSLPCSKRPKLEQVGTPGDAEATDNEVASQKPGSDLMQCTSSEKSRFIKQKRICDSKRIDKKNVRAGVRAKYDCFASKAGLANFDSGFLGNNIVGTYGLKSDIRDVTKHMEELSLSVLLDGSYKYSGLGKEKGKRALHLKDELLCSVKKVCSILSPVSVGSSDNRKDAAFILSTNLPSGNMSNCDDKDKYDEKSPAAIKDLSPTNFSNTTVYHPKDVLDRLALPSGQDLGSLLLSLSKSSAPSQPAMHCTTFRGASLPPFPWLHPQSGAYRPNVDSAKLGSTRSSSQWQWVRVGGNFTSIENEDSSVHTNEDLLREMETIEASMKDPCDKEFNICCTQSIPGSLLVQSGNSRKVVGEHGPQQLNTVEHGNSSDSYQKSDAKESYLLKTCRAPSPKVLHAAEILCEMSRSTDVFTPHGYSNGTVKWPKSPSEKTMKARKPSPFGTAESTSGSRPSEPIKSAANQSTKKLIDRKNDFTRMNNSGKGPIRWPVQIEGGASPSRSEKGPMLDTRQLHGNAARYSSHVSSQARLEKDYENQQKLKKATLTSSLGFTGVSAGDWKTARNRRI